MFSMVIILLVLVCIVGFFFPAWFQILLFAINVFVPDPIPFLDEIVQFFFIFHKFKEDGLF